MSVRTLRNFAWLGAFIASSCIYDPDEVCGSGQRLVNEACECRAGFVELPDGRCEACPENEVVRDGVCDCADGFARDESTTCAEIVAGIGQTCTTDADCLDPNFPFCANAANDGYCTSTGCAMSDECGEEFACNQERSPSFCERPPTGLGLACSSDADCAEFEASSCDTLVTGVCFVANCDLENDECFEGFICCDLSAFVGLGAPPTACVPPGDCP
ncbi:MAG: hypothetical protein AAF658_08335 [Myxococcota bacterium]